MSARTYLTEPPMSKPTALTEDQIRALERRVKERWQIHPADMAALFAMARERNEMVTGAAGKQAQQSTHGLMLSGHPWGSP